MMIGLRQRGLGEHLTPIQRYQCLFLYQTQCPCPVILCHFDPKILTKYSTVYLQEKNPRFREKGDSDEEDDDYDKRDRG
jgi:hypothetical protein